MSKKRIYHQKNNELTIKDIIIRCAIFSIAFCIIGFFVALIVSYFLYHSTDPSSLTQIAGISSLFFSTFLTSFIQSKINKQFYFLSSLLLGAYIFILTLVLCLLTKKLDFSATSFIWRLLIPVFSLLGGVIGSKRKTKIKKHHLKK